MLPPSHGLQVFCLCTCCIKNELKIWTILYPTLMLLYSKCMQGVICFHQFGDSGKEFQPPCLSYRYFRQFLKYYQNWFFLQTTINNPYLIRGMQLYSINKISNIVRQVICLNLSSYYYIFFTDLFRMSPSAVYPRSSNSIMGICSP